MEVHVSKAKVQSISKNHWGCITAIFFKTRRAGRSRPKRNRSERGAWKPNGEMFSSAARARSEVARSAESPGVTRRRKFWQLLEKRRQRDGMLNILHCSATKRR